MNKRFLISLVVMFVMSMAIGFFVHARLLGPEYAQLPGLFRSQQEQGRYFPYMLLANVFIAIGFVWIYLKGKEEKPFVAQGIRYGLAIAVLVTIPTYLIYYAVQPMPGGLVLKQIVFDTIGVILMGIIIAWLNK
jgi:hypothetical protein